MDFVPAMIDYGMCIDIIVYKFLVFVYFFWTKFPTAMQVNET